MHRILNVIIIINNKIIIITVIPTFDVSLMFLTIGIFTTEGDKNNMKPIITTS